MIYFFYTFAPMKNLIVIILLIILLGSCTSTRYIEVPVDRIKLEYRDKTKIDTLIQKDSIITLLKGDTVFLEKYKYLYKIKEVRDTVAKTDTVTTVQTIEVEKKVNELKNWQIALMVLGGGFIILCIYKILRQFKQ